MFAWNSNVVIVILIKFVLFLLLYKISYSIQKEKVTRKHIKSITRMKTKPLIIFISSIAVGK